MAVSYTHLDVYKRQGHLIMTDEWFDEYMFRLVVETKYVPAKIMELFKQKPLRLPAWDLSLIHI